MKTKTELKSSLKKMNWHPFKMLYEAYSVSYLNSLYFSKCQNKGFNVNLKLMDNILELDK